MPQLDRMGVSSKTIRLQNMKSAVLLKGKVQRVRQTVSSNMKKEQGKQQLWATKPYAPAKF